MGQVTSSSAKIDLLTPIWQRALGRTKIGPDENFFELGGDPSAAVQIFQEVARAGGTKLPAFVICQVPTISSLAALLADTRPLEFPPLVQLKPGASGLPVFVTHGVGGHLLEFCYLVREMKTPRPIYGLQTRGMDDVGEPFERIEDMAKYFLETIRSTQPHGPYTLIGYSLGGLVTLEMARRLKESGEQIAMLALLDSYPGREALALGQQVRLVGQLVVNRLLRKPPGQADAGGGTADAAAAELDEYIFSFPAMRRVLAGSSRSLSRYRPTPYPGRVRFVQASIPSKFPVDPIPVWGPFLPDMTVESVPGDHHGILKGHAQELASVLNRYLKETENS